jgi:peptidoglycan/LPS O-acetylase OafA/YrhL
MSVNSFKNSRLLHVDALKAFAAQLIVLHHLSAYGPVADAVHGLAPQLMAWLYQYGRMAVQVFLVVGGFLSARALSARGQMLEGGVAGLLWRRYLRLALPFMAAVLLTLACSGLVARWLPELVPQSVSATQLIAHGLLLHGVLRQESLTVGAWYVAMDFQLFALLLGLLWLARSARITRLPRAVRRFVGPALVLMLALASLFVFNRIAALDAWAPYFFAAYGLGALVHWLGLSPHRRWSLALLSAVVVVALLFDFRERIALALLTALLLAALQRRHQFGQPLLRGGRKAAAVAHLGTQTYSLFLVHFSICLLVNALFADYELSSGWAGLAALLVAWGLSNLAAMPFYRWVEAPAGRVRLGWLLPRPLRA